MLVYGGVQSCVASAAGAAGVAKATPPARGLYNLDFSAAKAVAAEAVGIMKSCQAGHTIRTARSSYAESASSSVARGSKL